LLFVAGLVVGIFPDSDPQALERALSAQQIDLGKVKVVGGDPSDDEPSKLTFVDVIEEMESNSLTDDMTTGLGVWDETGTGVPGLGGERQPSLAAFKPHDHPAKRYFASFAIPTDEIDNFGDAVAEGRSVVLYPDAGADEEKIAAAFRAAGLRNVRAY
jgi:hypothetical protein